MNGPMTGAYDISHLLAGAMLVTSFALLYQQRIVAVLNIFAAQSITLALAVAWTAWSDHRPDLFITALIALALKGIVIPVALRRTVERLGIHREVGSPAHRLHPWLIAEVQEPGRMVGTAAERRDERLQGLGAQRCATSRASTA